MHILYSTPHGLLIILALIFAIIALIPKAPAAPWTGLSWACFVAAFIFGP